VSVHNLSSDQKSFSDQKKQIERATNLFPNILAQAKHNQLTKNGNTKGKCGCDVCFGLGAMEASRYQKTQKNTEKQKGSCNQAVTHVHLEYKK